MATDALAVMAGAYGALRDPSDIAMQLKKGSTVEHSEVLAGVRLESFIQIVGILGRNDPEEFENFRKGLPLAAWLREMMVGMVAFYEGESARADEIVDTVLGDLAARLRERG